MKRISELIPRGALDQATHHGGRRASTRFPLEAQVFLLEPSQSSGFAINVSEGGIRVVLDRAITAGESCLILLRTGQEKEFRERARVVWSREMRDGCVAGLEFAA